VLGSGSRGNCTLVRAAGGIMLIDAGFGPRTIARRLIGTGVELEDVQAICMTHLDSDHFNPNLVATIARQGVQLFCHQKLAPQLRLIIRQSAAAPDDVRAAERLIKTFRAGAFEPLQGVFAQPIHLPHDRDGSHGFLLRCGSFRMGYATDLGRVPDTLLELFCGVHVLAIESNYDPEMERTSERPWFLKRRVMDGAGHLSNEQALAAVQTIMDTTLHRHGPDHLPRHVVLLHRSEQCNCPVLVRRLFETDHRLRDVLTLADQSQRTQWLRIEAGKPLIGEQLCLAWG
jgi:phosphoribosyl 1,2-cyclic phosphodiesterase